MDNFITNGTGKEFFSNLSIDHRSTIIFEDDITDHIKYVDQITREYAKNEKFADEQWAQGRPK
jgi:hypothetical protein